MRFPRPPEELPPPRGTSRRKAGALALVFIAAVFVLANRGLIVGDDYPIWDAATYYAPLYGLVADHARSGRILLWNPWSNAGSPDGVDPQVGAFSPLTVAFGLLTGGGVVGFRLYWLTMWSLASFGTYLLARSRKVDPWSAAACGLAFGFSGFFLGHAQHTSFIVAAAFLPALVWRLDRALDGGSRLAAAQAGLIWGLAGLSGYPALTILNGCFAALWCVYWLASQEKLTAKGLLNRARVAAQMLVVMVAVGLVIIAPTYVGFFVEGGGYSDRVGALQRELAIGSNALHPGAAATMTSPYLAVVKRANRELWSYTDPSSVSIYIAVPILALALLGLIRPRRALADRGLFFAGLIFLGAAMGRALPIRGWMYDLLPPMRYFRHSAIFRVYFLFVVAILAMEALRTLAAADEGKRRAMLRALAALTVALGLVAIVTYLAVTQGLVLDFNRGRAQIALATSWVATLAAAIVAQRRPAVRWAPVLLALLVGGDAISATQLASGVMVARDRTTRELWFRIEQERSGALGLGSSGVERECRYQYIAVQNNLNLYSKRAVLLGYSPFSSGLFNEWRRDPSLSTVACSRDRIWFARESVEAGVSRANFAILARRTREIGLPPLVLHPRRDEPTRLTQSFLRLSPIEPIAFEIERYEPNRLDLAVTAPSDGWLLVTDRWANGWRARVDGRPAEVVRADFVFRAVRLTPGRHQISLKYRPFGWPWLLLASWAVIAGLVLTTVGLLLVPSAKSRPVIPANRPDDSMAAPGLDGQGSGASLDAPAE